MKKFKVSSETRPGVSSSFHLAAKQLGLNGFSPLTVMLKDILSNTMNVLLQSIILDNSDLISHPDSERPHYTFRSQLSSAWP